MTEDRSWSLPEYFPRPREILTLLVNGAARVAGNAGVEQLPHVHRVEHVGAVAEITVHLDLASLGQNRAGFRFAQTLQHAAYAVTRTSTPEIDRSRFKNPHIVFVEQPMHDLGVRQAL